MSTNVLPLTAPEMGVCGVCQGKFTIGQTESCTPRETKLVFFDRPTGIKLGLCCVEAMRQADGYFNRFGPAAGIVHPTPAIP